MSSQWVPERADGALREGAGTLDATYRSGDSQPGTRHGTRSVFHERRSNRVRVE